jgi:hypothetical protein
VLTAGAVVVLWWPATRGLNGAELVSARLDALKVGLSVAVGRRPAPARRIDRSRFTTGRSRVILLS